MLIGAYSPAALRRVGQWADGFLGPVLPPELMQEMFEGARGAWRGAGRSGEPRLVVGMYYSLGPNSQEPAEQYIRDFFGFGGDRAEQIAQSILPTPEVIKEAMRLYEDIGADELILWPAVAGLDQIDRLADTIC